jgi:hypothetical protein
MNKFLVILMILTICACAGTDLCETAGCSAKSTCFDGTCYCNPGFEGAKCTIEQSEKFLGTWKGQTFGKTTRVLANGSTQDSSFTRNFNVTILRASEKSIIIQKLSGFAGDIEIPLSKTNAALNFYAWNPTSKIRFEGDLNLVNPVEIRIDCIETDFSKAKTADCVITLKK